MESSDMETLIRFKTNVDVYIIFLWIEWLKMRIYAKCKMEQESLSWNFL